GGCDRRREGHVFTKVSRAFWVYGKGGARLDGADLATVDGVGHTLGLRWREGQLVVGHELGEQGVLSHLEVVDHQGGNALDQLCGADGAVLVTEGDGGDGLGRADGGGEGHL